MEKCFKEYLYQYLKMKLKELKKKPNLGWSEKLKKDIFLYKEPFDYKHENKKLIPDEATNDQVIKIFNLYYQGNSYQTISNLYNKEKVFGKTNWKDSTILKIIENPIYKGDFIHGKRTKNPTYYEDDVELLISKEYEKNAKYRRKRTQEIIKD